MPKFQEEPKSRKVVWFSNFKGTTADHKIVKSCLDHYSTANPILMGKCLDDDIFQQSPFRFTINHSTVMMYVIA